MILLIFLVSALGNASQVRELPLKVTEVGVVNTAVGYSTVIQVPAKPLNVVLGDQAAFRIEFINDSITVKPLKSGAKSNLFIFTERDRFNLTIKSGPSTSVDYVVRIRRSYEDPKAAKVINRSHESKGLRFTLLKSSNAFASTFIDFSVTNTGKKKRTLKPEDFRYASGTSAIPMKSLFLDGYTIEPGSSTFGAFSLPSLKSTIPCTIWVGVRDEKPTRFSFLTSAANKEIKNAAQRMD